MAAPVNPQAQTAKGITTTLDVLLQGKTLLGNKPGIQRITKVVDMNPLPNSNQLVVKGLSQGTKLYQITLNIFDVKYSRERSQDFPLSVQLKNGTAMYAAQIPINGRKVMCRCQCKDFYFRWWYWNNKNKALAGPPFPAYVRKTAHYPEVNPLHIPGACKHIISLVDRLVAAKILTR